jgi:hypothetical protein
MSDRRAETTFDPKPPFARRLRHVNDQRALHPLVAHLQAPDLLGARLAGFDYLAPKRSQPPGQHSRLGRSPRPFDALDGQKISRVRHTRSAAARRDQQPRRRFEAGDDATTFDCLHRHQRHADRRDPGKHDLEAPKLGSGRDRRFDGFGEMR